MLYHAIMVFGLNEVAPVEQIEIIVIIILMSLSALLNAYLFGEMAMLVQQMSKKDIEYQETLDNANTAMYSLQITDPTQDLIREYIVSVNDAKVQQTEMKEFINIISPGLKQSISRYIFFVSIFRNNFIRKMLKEPLNIKFLEQYKFKKRTDNYLYSKFLKNKYVE